MTGFTSLEVYNFVFNKTEENNISKIYTDSSDEISFVKSKKKVVKAIDLSVVSPENLQHKIYGPDIIKTYRKLSLEKSQTVG